MRRRGSRVPAHGPARGSHAASDGRVAQPAQRLLTVSMPARAGLFCCAAQTHRAPGACLHRPDGQRRASVRRPPGKPWSHGLCVRNARPASRARV